MRCEIRPSSTFFQLARLTIELADGVQTLVVAELGAIHGASQHADRFVINAERNRKGVSVFSAVGQREARRIAETARRAVHHFRHVRERLDRSRTDAGRKEKLRKISWPALGRR